MVIDQLIEQTIQKKNPSCVGIDPDWEKIPQIYKTDANRADTILRWARDIIDSVADVVGIIKPQMAFYEIYGGDGIAVFQKIVEYAHQRGLVVIDDSKRNDIGNTAKAYAYAHLAPEGFINADFLTVSPFLGIDSLQPFVDIAKQKGKGIFILVKTSNPGSVEISEAKNAKNQRIRDYLAEFVHQAGLECIGSSGYSSIGAVVGATFPEEAKELRENMTNNYFLVPGFGVQGGTVKDIAKCFNEDGLGAVVNSSRGILYQHLEISDYDQSKGMYLDIVREQAKRMQRQIYEELQTECKKIVY